MEMRERGTYPYNREMHPYMYTPPMGIRVRGIYPYYKRYIPL